jgi:uncharacterized membrane protein
MDPVEYVIIEFPGNTFTGEIAPALAALVDRGLVRILDLVFVNKDADGNVLYFEYDDLEELGQFAEIDGEADGLLNDEDIEALAESLAPESSALFIVWEDVWAGDFARAVRNAGGRLIAGERLSEEVLEAVLAGSAPGSGDHDTEGVRS